jgi:hypothetical protein
VSALPATAGGPQKRGYGEHGEGFSTAAYRL